MTPRPARLTVIVVSYESSGALEQLLPVLACELSAADELVIVDNGSTDGSAQLARTLLPLARVIETGANLGFPAACNAGAAAADGDVLLFLNPDCRPHAGFGAAIRRPFDAQPDWVAWQGLVTTEGGEVVNTAGNEVHVTGLAWAGQAGVPVSRADLRRREVAYLSGACLAVRRAAFEAVGGFEPWLFLYHEDLDLSLRLRLAGGHLGLEPDAVVEHDYEFDKGRYKWRLLERNRWAVLVRLWPTRLLVAAAPLLVATELATWALALRGGWAAEKRQACEEAARALPRLVGERRALRAAGSVPAAEFAGWLTPRLSSPYLGRLATNRHVERAMTAYWAAALRVVGAAR